MAQTIDLAACQSDKSTIFVGKKEGIEARQTLGLEKAETSADSVKVIIPPGTTTISPSFLTGLFYESLKKLPAKEKFFRKFNFEIQEPNDSIREALHNDIETGISHAITALQLDTPDKRNK